MNLSEIKLALSLPSDLTRLKIVILDNLLELFMFQVVRKNAFDEWHFADEDSSLSSKRLAIFRSFYDKQKYCVKKGVFSEETGYFYNVFHELRNLAYHQAFENVTSSSSSPMYSEHTRVEYHAEMQSVYSRLTNLYAISILELFETHDNNSDFKQFNSFIEANSSLKEDMKGILKNNLSFRIKKLKSDLAYIDGLSDAESKERDFHEFQTTINHVTFNYGHEVIEKAPLENRIKLKFMEMFQEHPDFIDVENLEDRDAIFTTTEILEWENSIPNLSNAPNYLASVIAWDKINKKLQILEEIIEFHIFIAC
jgi:hypothetical protein